LSVATFILNQRDMLKMSKEPDPWTKPDIDRPWPEDEDDEEED